MPRRDRRHVGLAEQHQLFPFLRTTAGDALPSSIERIAPAMAAHIKSIANLSGGEAVSVAVLNIASMALR
jgi:hypothetical protein